MQPPVYLTRILGFNLHIYYSTVCHENVFYLAAYKRISFVSVVCNSLYVWSFEICAAVYTAVRC